MKSTKEFKLRGKLIRQFNIHERYAMIVVEGYSIHIAEIDKEFLYRKFPKGLEELECEEVEIIIRRKK